MSALRPDIVDHIKKCYEEEQLNPPIPRKFGDIPISYDAITAEWLTSTLAQNYPGNVVKSFKLGPRDSGSFNRRRIHLEWDGQSAENLPKSVFCKAAHEILNRIMLANGGTLSEVTFYNSIRPNLEIETSVCHFAGYNPDSWASMIMLHDMPDVTFCTHNTTLSKEQFAQQIQTLAKLHGRYYLSKEAFFPNLITFHQRFQNLVNNLDLESSCRNGFREGKSMIPPRLFSREDEIWPATLKSVKRNGSLPETVIHSDVHLGNWYITRKQRMGLTDWQAMSRGHWSRDLAYVLGTGVSTDKRRLWEKEMVRMYVKELAEAGGPKVTEDEAWLELRRQSFGALAYWTCTLAPSAAMPDMQPEEPTLLFIGRIAALIDDHDALGSFEKQTR